MDSVDDGLKIGVGLSRVTPVVHVDQIGMVISAHRQFLFGRMNDQLFLTRDRIRPAGGYDRGEKNAEESKQEIMPMLFGGLWWEFGFAQNSHLIMLWIVHPRFQLSERWSIRWH